MNPVRSFLWALFASGVVVNIAIGVLWDSPWNYPLAAANAIGVALMLTSSERARS